MKKNLALALLALSTLGCTFHPELAPATLKQESPMMWTGAIPVHRSNAGIR